jgi:quercetin dioxygenase-like cupin family protein
VRPTAFYSPSHEGRKESWSVCVLRLLPDTPTSETSTYHEHEDGLTMKRTTSLVAVAVTVLALLALVVGVALATTPSGVTPTLLTRATLGQFVAHNDGITLKSPHHSADVTNVRVDIQPGGTTGWHHHPGIAVVAVGSGTVTEYDEECQKTVIQAGHGFVESHDRVHLVHNEGSVPAVLYVTFITRTETPQGVTIDAPQPQGCDKH